MTIKTDMTLFEDYEIRRVYDEDAEIWWFSVIDIVRVLTQQPDYQTARKYWNKLKQRLGREGSESVTICHRLLESKRKRLHNPNLNCGESATIKSSVGLNGEVYEKAVSLRRRKS